MHDHGGAKDLSMRMAKKLAIVALTAIVYVLFFFANKFLFSFTEFSFAVHWIYLPSGIILMSVLLFAEWAALGVMIASAIISYHFYFLGNFGAALGTGFISGFSPWAARLLCIAKLKLDVDLHQLNASTLLKVASVFALFSALLHQFWYLLHGHSDNFFGNIAVMAAGDFFGTLIVLYLAKLSIGLLPITDDAR
jgi:hypothetical protein